MVKVAVLMSTYNGGRYIEQQLESLSSQEGVEVELLVRDDGSSDSTCAILEKWRAKMNLRWYTGENLGSAWSFMDLLYNAPAADYYAFCDQDDVWFSHKLQRAVEKITACKEGEGREVLYFSAQRLTDGDLNVIGDSVPRRLFTFGESLLRNPAAGCTMVFNNKLMQLVKREKPSYLYMHDMWLYMVCMAVGGLLLFDAEPTMFYRQHGGNVVGYNASLLATIKRRFKSFLAGKEAVRLKTCRELLRCYACDMPQRHRDILECVAAYRSSFAMKCRAAFLPELTSVEWWTRIAVVLTFFANRF